MEYKSIPQFHLKAIDERTVTGIFAVHGNVDDGRDRGHPGLFGDFTSGGRKRAVFLWQHNSMEPPIATIDRLFEVSAADLPPAVRLYAPEATGGVAVVRTYLDTPRGNEVLAGLKAGAITEMSYAYDPTRWDFEDGEQGLVRNLYAADLLDVSDVNWGMNPATSADGTKAGQPLTIEAQAARAAVQKLTERFEGLYALRVVKEGRRFSAATLTEITEAIGALKEAATRLEKLVAAPDDGKASRAAVRAAYLEWQQRRTALLELGAAL